jgi:hypothetical protein
MNGRRSVYAATPLLAILLCASVSDAATITVPAGGDLQAAITAARPGDTILLAPGATYVGNFKLPVHGGTEYVTIRSGASDALLPGVGQRISPAYAASLPKIVSSNNVAALRTAPGAAYWKLMFLELGPNANASGTALDLGDGSSAQYALSQVPHHFIVDRVFIHGSPIHGLRRGIGLNSADTTIINSHISDIKGIGQDTQAIGGWNGPGPYWIENNYLEAAGEVVMFGGDDPKIPGLTPSDIVFRGNVLSRPLSWRDPLVPAPTSPRASLTADGILAPGTYAYRVVARRVIGGMTARSLATAEASIVLGETGGVLVQWDAVPGATEYLVYGRTAGAQGQYWRTTGTSLVDAGTVAGTLGTVPTTATVWQVKNIFELKNARRVQADFNLLENNWAQAQTGDAVLFTPRNQYGTCTWCVVESVIFEHNVVRRTGGGIQILGWDDERPSARLNNVVVRHNEFSDMGSAWGGAGYFLYVIDGALDVTIDHNTVISTNGMGVIMADKRPAENFVFTNNVMRHNTYGIIGSDFGIGLSSITQYFPGGVFERNVFAGGSASRYPANNLFPTVASFEAHFVDYLNADYALVPGTDWAHAGTDGLDLGAIDAELPVVDPGPGTLAVTTTGLAPGMVDELYSVTLAATGGLPNYQWTLTAGSFPTGVLLNAATGEIEGVPTQSGAFNVTLRVTDGGGATASASFTLQIAPAIDPVDIITTSLPDGVATVPYAAALQATGGSGHYAWSLTSGTLPAGLGVTTTGVLQGTTTQTGQTVVTITVTDAADPRRQASRSFALTVRPKANVAPAVTLLTPAHGAVVPVGSTLTLAAAATDSDGAIARVDFFINDAKVASTPGSGVASAWVVPTAGTYTVRAVAVDNAGASSLGSSATVTTRSEIVVTMAQLTRMSGNYQAAADTTAAGGRALWNPNRGVKPRGALAAPTTVAEFEFYAEAGRPYQLWVRGRAEANSTDNDSVHLQFSNVVAAPIGSTLSLVVTLEDGQRAGVAGWGWQDHRYGIGRVAEPIVFTRTGVQTIRLQPREDGFMIDQIVLSPEQFKSAAPGALKNDTTIVQ